MSARWKAESSPVHRAVWDRAAGPELFDGTAPELRAPIRAIVDQSVDIVRGHKRAGSLYGPDSAVAPEVVRDLAAAGYWGLRAGRDHGGTGANFRELVQVITEVGVADPWVAALISFQACFGPIHLLEAFGTPQQKDRLLPPLVTGRRLGVFAITEPGAATDWGAIRTQAQREGDRRLARQPQGTSWVLPAGRRARPTVRSRVRWGWLNFLTRLRLRPTSGSGVTEATGAAA